MLICWGILLLARPSLTGKEIGQHIGANDSDLSLFDPQYYVLNGEAVPEWVADNSISRNAVGVYGPSRTPAIDKSTQYEIHVAGARF